jgi:hypothetical protein
MLKLDMGDEKRSIVERLLAEAKKDLPLATTWKNSNSGRHREDNGATRSARYRDYHLPLQGRRGRARAGNYRARRSCTMAPMNGLPRI